MDIAFIAPFDRLRVKAQTIIDTSNFPAKTYLGDLQKGVEVAKQAFDEGAKIIISRGGTAHLIRQQLDVEVIEVKCSISQTLAFIYEKTSTKTKIGIVGFKQFINDAEAICDILGRSYKSFEIKVSSLFKVVNDEVERWKPDVVIGDAVSFQWAQTKSLNAYLIESSMETITEAFERAMLVLNNLNRHITNEKKLSAVLNCTKEGAILVDRDGEIQEINLKGCEILGATRSNLLGDSLSNYLRSKELTIAFKKRQVVRNILLTYKNKKLAIDHIAIASDDTANSSAVILFQQTEKIQETSNAIRKKLLNTGFYAKYNFSDIHYKSDRMKSLITFARQYSLTDSNIMIQGETGTGKELLAQSIHSTSPLAEGPFVAVNCAALSGSLLESELFGYAPGAFTGALRTGKTGLFEMAQDGTLFLDELSEMDIFLQSKLLRALQTREIMRVGGNKVIPVKVRIIAATNKIPSEEIQKGKLRADLFYRINVLDLAIPPLRDRDGDAEFLFTHFLNERSNGLMRAAPVPSHSLMTAIKKYPWPGNVRELENFAKKYVILQPLLKLDSVATALLLPDAEISEETETLNDIIRANIIKIYKQQNCNISKTAKKLAIDRNTVKRWLKKQPDE